jgi:hypothetical protein
MIFKVGSGIHYSEIHNDASVGCRVADPDPYPDPDWIRILSGQWIRIQNPDPDPGGQK